MMDLMGGGPCPEPTATRTADGSGGPDSAEAGTLNERGSVNSKDEAAIRLLRLQTAAEGWGRAGDDGIGTITEQAKLLL